MSPEPQVKAGLKLADLKPTRTPVDNKARKNFLSEEKQLQAGLKTFSTLSKMLSGKNEIQVKGPYNTYMSVKKEPSGSFMVSYYVPKDKLPSSLSKYCTGYAGGFRLNPDQKTPKEGVNGYMRVKPDGKITTSLACQVSYEERTIRDRKGNPIRASETLKRDVAKCLTPKNEISITSKEYDLIDKALGTKKSISVGEWKIEKGTKGSIRIINNVPFGESDERDSVKLGKNPTTGKIKVEFSVIDRDGKWSATKEPTYSVPLVQRLVEDLKRK